MLGLRIGIDVGGTFTHGVVLKPPGEVLSTAVTPTTHTHDQGVAAGIATVLRELTAGLDAAQGRVELVAHSTTQATNALLEGDVSPVQRVVIMPPGEETACRWALVDESLDLGGGHAVSLKNHFIKYIDITNGVWKDAILPELTDKPVAIIQPLAGDAANLEHAVAQELLKPGRPVVCASDITQVLGLQARARTTVVNASMLPTMLATADFTERAVSEVLPGVPVQVVRSDGGAMSLDEMRRMPILSILSGPAAGASAALHRSGLSEVIFIEVGGTSTDITLIKEGRVRHRYATVGGHRLMVPALDLRTVAVGGGSMLRADVSQFGPRSAHKAGLPYLFERLKAGARINRSRFWRAGELVGPEVLQWKVDSTHRKSSREYDENTYLVAEMDDGEIAAITISDYWLEADLCGNKNMACRELGIDLETFDHGSLAIIESFSLWSRISTVALSEAHDKTFLQIDRAVDELLEGHGADSSEFTLLGGGGGAWAVTPAVASLSMRKYDLIDHHAVISAIGAALAVTCVSQSKTVADPNSADIAELVAAVETKLAAQGAERVSTDFEFDPHRQVLTVTGRGNRPYDQEAAALSAEDIAARASELVNQKVELAWDGGDCVLFTGAQGSGKRGGSSTAALALDRSGRSLWQGRLKEHYAASGGERESVLAEIIESRTQYTDGGPAMPGLALVCAGRLIPLDTLGNKELIAEVLRWENLPADAPGCFILRK